MNGVTIPSLSLSHSSLLWNRVIGLNRERERERGNCVACEEDLYDGFGI